MLSVYAISILSAYVNIHVFSADHLVLSNQSCALSFLGKNMSFTLSIP